MFGLPGYAGAVSSPGLVQALAATRAHLAGFLPADWGRGGAFAAHPAETDPPLDDPAQLPRWQAESRMSVLVFELVGGLLFSMRGTQAWLDLAQPGAVPMPLLGITRPPHRLLAPQAALVEGLAPMREQPKSDDPAVRERMAEILAQAGSPLAFWCALLPVHPERMPRTMELLSLCFLLAGHVEQRFKHALAVARPHEVNPAILPAILTPAHGSFPSGHATEAFTVAGVLAALLAPQAVGPVLGRLAARIAHNREVAGVHYPMDSVAGCTLGGVLADYLVARCTGGGALQPRWLDGSQLPADVSLPVSGALPAAADWLPVPEGSAAAVPPSDTLQWLWQRARAEWCPAPAPADQAQGRSAA